MPGRRGAQRTYPTDRIAVHWESTRCIQTARCLNALPEVFDVQRRPWVDIEAAAADAVAEAVMTPAAFERNSHVAPPPEVDPAA